MLSVENHATLETVPDPPDKPPLPTADELFEKIPDETKEMLVEMFHPGMAEAWKRFVADMPAAFNLQAARDCDPVALAAVRILQAVTVAVRLKDVDALRSWENQTLVYMQNKALDEYLMVSLPPRPTTGRQRHDRHLILGALRERVAKFLREYKPPMTPAGLLEGVINNVSASVQLQALVQQAFPHLHQDPAIENSPIAARVEAMMALDRPLSELDPEDVILDGLVTLGVPRPTAQNWLKGASK